MQGKKKLLASATVVLEFAKMGRGDKVRTYNWSQQRVTDHRCGITVHDLDGVMEGRESLDEIMAACEGMAQSKRFGDIDC